MLFILQDSLFSCPVHELHQEGDLVPVVEGLDGALPAAGLLALEVDFQLPACSTAGLGHPHEQRGRRAKGGGHGSGRRAPGAAGPNRAPQSRARRVSVSLSPKSLPAPSRAAPPPLSGALPAAVRRPEAGNHIWK